MNQVKFASPSNSNSVKDDFFSSPANILNDSFLPTSMDTSIYFIQQYCKLIYDNFAAASSRAIDESFAEKERKSSSASNEHRFILFTFNETDQLQLRHTWKDSYSLLQDELKNISHESRVTTNHHVNTSPYTDGYETDSSSSKDSKEFIHSVSQKFEEFVDKFEAAYFNCTNLTGGNFVLKESENVFTFCLSNQKSKLEHFNEKLRVGWQRKNIFIQLHPKSYKEYCDSRALKDCLNYFPVTNLRDSDQLARSLCHANIFNSFETPNMELLGKGGLVDFSIDLHSYKHVCKIGLLKPSFIGKPKWPVPTTLTEDSWSNSKPKLFIQNSFDSELIPKIQFDEYITYCPAIYEILKQDFNCKMFTISVQSNIGIVPIGFGELIDNTSSNVPLFKIFIGPYNFDQLTDVMYGFEPFSKYLQNIPQFYEYFLHSNLGEHKWNDLCKQSGGKSTWRNEFPLPNGLVTSKNYFKTSWRQRCKNDLVLLVERADNSHRLRTSRRQSSYHPSIFPSLTQLKKDSGHLERLMFRFKNSLQVFLASSDAKLGCSSELNQFQLSHVLFEHCMPVHQMTDFSEVLQKKRSLRPLFNENERDLFHILKDMPCLAEEMASSQFVCGDIFGNPYKKERKTREPSKMAKKRAHLNPHELASIEEIYSSSDSESIDDVGTRMLSPMSIDEIDFKEMEDIETEILLNGSITNLPETKGSKVSIQYDLSTLEKWIKSPGGLEAKTKLIEHLPIITDLEDLTCLLNWSKRFKRIKMSQMISERIYTVNK